MDLMAIIWLVLVVVFAIVEAATLGLASIWFCVGALAAFITATCRGPLWLQIVLFLVVSAVTMILIRPLAKKYLTPRQTRTNAHRIIDTEAGVTETIDNVAGTGQVKTGGNTWTARSETGQTIPEGSRVRVLRIEGVRAFVEPLTESSGEPSE